MEGLFIVLSLRPAAFTAYCPEGSEWPSETDDAEDN